jgi:poly-gamma-glutamate synthesis protein (capsule biosynthesis protein)
MKDATLCLTGDTLATRCWSTEPGFEAVLDQVQQSPVAFTNLETPLHDYSTAPAGDAQGPHLRGPPAIAAALHATGFRLVSVANNHIMDWGPGGLQATLDHLDRADLCHAGAGNSLPEARCARILETAQGRIALLAFTTSFPCHARAGESYGDHPARPGVSVLRHQQTLGITGTQLAQLRDIQQALDLPTDWRPGPPNPDHFHWLGRHFVTGDAPIVASQPNAKDLESLLEVIRDARSQAELVLVSMHTHEQQGRDRYAIPAFVQMSTRAMIDAGADIIVGHGPHVLRGIESYRAGIILHSLGNFIFQPDTLPRLATDDYAAMGWQRKSAAAWPASHPLPHTSVPIALRESLLVTLRWRRGQGGTLRLVPLLLADEPGASHHGLPALADAATGQRILAQLVQRSAALGARIVLKDQAGWLALP